MALVSTIVPTFINLQIPYGLENEVPNDIVVRLVPKNWDGTVADMTSATAVTLYFDNGSNTAAGFGNFSFNGTMVAHDATGITVFIAASDLNTSLPGFLRGGSTGGRLSVSAGDGTNHYMIALGSWTLQLFGA